jgi:alpha-1,2-mannosyltransferase
MVNLLKVGIFHPPINMCGGAEGVAVSIIDSLKKAGYQIIVLTNAPIDREKIRAVFGKEIRTDEEFVFPFELFPTTNSKNVYTDYVRALLLKRKCDVLIDTQSNGIIPGANIAYIHHPIFGRFSYKTHKVEKKFFFLHQKLEKILGGSNKRLIFSNSKYTSKAIAKFIGVHPILLYPPISNVFFENHGVCQNKEDVVLSVSRISPEKNLTSIPLIAKMVDRRIRFLIVGIRQSEQEMNRILSMIEKNGVSDRVKVLTDVSRDQLIRIMKLSKVFLHVAYGEHFGMSIVEAMASGCIPIVHDSGGPAEFVPDNLRFHSVLDAALKIDEAILKWSAPQSDAITNSAMSFSESNFSARFLEIFRLYLEKNHYFSDL